MVKTDNRSILLVVDDDDDILFFKEFILEINPEIEFIVFKDGKEVIDALNRAKRFPTVVLMDLYVPRKNGFEMLKEIKSTECLKSLHVFLYAEIPHRDQVQKAYDYGADLFIPKPAAISEMKTLINFINELDLETFIKPTIDNFIFTY